MALIHEKMILILKETSAIAKDRDNAQQKFKYRGIDDVYKMINPLLKSHGVFMTSETVAERQDIRTTKNGATLYVTTVTMRYHFHAEDGSAIFTECVGKGMDSADKDSNKALASAHKYALVQAFAIPCDEPVDVEAHHHDESAPTKADMPFTVKEKNANQDEAIAHIAEIKAIPHLKNWYAQNRDAVKANQKVMDAVNARKAELAGPPPEEHSDVEDF
jgi:hypothetical protein